jgi:hypothetical protein
VEWPAGCSRGEVPGALEGMYEFAKHLCEINERLAANLQYPNEPSDEDMFTARLLAVGLESGRVRHPVPGGIVTMKMRREDLLTVRGLLDAGRRYVGGVTSAPLAIAGQAVDPGPMSLWLAAPRLRARFEDVLANLADASEASVDFDCEYLVREFSAWMPEANGPRRPRG